MERIHRTLVVSRRLLVKIFLIQWLHLVSKTMAGQTQVKYALGTMEMALRKNGVLTNSKLWLIN